MTTFFIGTVVEDGIPSKPEKGQRVVKYEHDIKNVLMGDEITAMDVIILGKNMRREDIEGGNETLPISNELMQKIERTGALIERLG